MNRYAFLLIVLSLMAVSLRGQTEAEWLRYPAISPDGKTIAFSHRGDIYVVPTAGGPAQPLTVHPAYDFMPVWSNDGKTLAFASDRYGNMDIFRLPVAGGEAVRLTWHSYGEFPYCFSPDDQFVLFGSTQADDPANQQFPSGVLPELYQVPVAGGRPRLVLTTPAQDARISTDGSVLIFHDRKGYEDEFRKHHTSSVARDIWKYETGTGRYTRLSDFPGEDRNAVFAPGEGEICFLSERSGSFNIWKTDLEGREPVQLTRFDRHPVRSLSISRDGTLCFSYDGRLYTLREGEEPRLLQVRISQDLATNEERMLPAKGEISEMSLSPGGKEVAFVHRGEVFVASVQNGTTRRITDTPEQERSVSFSPDGRSLLYAGERDGSWNIYRTDLAREDEKYFFQATVLSEQIVISTDADEFQPAWSPDGKEVAFLEDRTTLKVIDLSSKTVRTILPGDQNYSYSDGDQHYAWSPDGQWFLVQFLQPRQWISQAGLVSSRGGAEPVNLTLSGYSDGSPRWALGGKAMLWFSDRDGMKNDASWGGQADAYAMFFDQEAWDRFRLSKEEFQLLKEEEEAAAKKDSTDAKGGKRAKPDVKPLKLDLSAIEDRKVRLTIHSSELADALLSADGEKLFYLAKFEKGWDLWQTELRTRETKVLSKLGAGSVGDLLLDQEGKTLFFLADGQIQKVEIESGKKESVPVSGEMVLREAAERRYLYDHIVRQVAQKFYVTDLHGVDWKGYSGAYRRFLPHIRNDYDFAEMLSELLGELNASHTGARYRPNDPQGDKTASLGLFYDQDHVGPGVKILEVMAKSPVVRTGSRIRPGVIIEALDAQPLNADTPIYRLLNRREGQRTRLSLYDPVSRSRWEEVVRPISLGEESELLYRRWVNRCRSLVDSLSGGRIGYVHVRGMNDPSFRAVYEEALGRHAGKEALVVDTRFNGGGWLHDDLATFLDGDTYITFLPRGQDLGDEPQFKWRRPSVVVMSEGNYSDAHMFPYAYKALGIGKLIGMPVPGTGTAVWWERLQSGLVFGIPQVGMLDREGRYLENQQLEPDIRVPNDPGEVRRGRDQQLEAAVRELLRTVDK
jgi:tricorn protease